jgi:DNA-binding MarR family transcriptional regulator
MEQQDRASVGENEATRSAEFGLAAGLSKIALAMRHHAWATTSKRGLTPTQAQVLAVLAGRREESLTVSRLASELAVTQPTISEAVAALTRKGLVQRDRSESDRRRVCVRLTRTGRSEADASALWPDALQAAVDSLDDRERGVMTRAVIKMIRTLQETGRIPVARMCPTCVHFRPNVHADPARPHHCAYVDAPLGDAGLRLDCPDHVQADAAERQRLWNVLIEGRQAVGA